MKLKMKTNMHIKKELGNIGEQIAVEYLEKNNYQILKRNFYCKQGEIDIIAKDKNEYVFIEVKTRTSKQYGNPVDAVTNIKQRHIWKSTKYYVYINKLENAYIRFDIIEILKKENKFYLHHIKNAIN